MIFVTQMQGCVLLRSVPRGINCHTGLHCMALIKNEFSNFRGLWKISLGLAWLPELQKKVSQSSNLQEDWSSTLVVGQAKLWLSVCSADGAFISTSCGKLEWIRPDALTFPPFVFHFWTYFKLQYSITLTKCFWNFLSRWLYQAMVQSY